MTNEEKLIIEEQLLDVYLIALYCYSLLYFILAVNSVQNRWELDSFQVQEFIYSLIVSVFFDHSKMIFFLNFSCLTVNKCHQVQLFYLYSLEAQVLFFLNKYISTWIESLFSHKWLCKMIWTFCIIPWAHYIYSLIISRPRHNFLFLWCIIARNEILINMYVQF